MRACVFMCPFPPHITVVCGWAQPQARGSILANVQYIDSTACVLYYSEPSLLLRSWIVSPPFLIGFTNIEYEGGWDGGAPKERLA